MSRARSRIAQSWCASVQEGRFRERYFAGNLNAGALYAWLEDCQELTNSFVPPQNRTVGGDKP
jgi:hypothetical protein